MMNEAVKKAFEEGAAEQRKRNAGKEIFNINTQDTEPDYPYCFGNLHIEFDGEIIAQCKACAVRKKCLERAVEERKHEKVFIARLRKAIKKIKQERRVD